MFVFQDAKITKIDKINQDFNIQVQTSGNKNPINVTLLSLYGTFYKPKIGDMVKLFKDSGNNTPTNRIFAMYYKPFLQPDIETEGDFATGNFLTKCYLKFFGKNLETSEAIEKIKIQPKTELSLKVGNNEFKATNTGFDMQTTQFNVGAGANYVLTTTATIIAPTGGGACTITFAGQNIMKI